ncbi:PucR family transcriptional regulator [Rhodococcus sp. RS1C4]|uniref:PucR family transcriptional regulator n=1 Tax=Nocardiaceae TaxID=85025 RepID=UPI00036358F1|nr:MULTISPECIES: PucR family transcriptional regulator [Rhodococcus]OZC45970.1 PucR family transcriptional regulator [Rhodococcus sp. 06-621-2]OZC48569.1 PucR family transcriptional regulator [Rhodococcus sp. RS1C4]OZC85406.1 PucR family transcriptional regulator [Rhodococcus sp. 06-418-1B]OZD12744.1 PucR family transcriptional regulator [Rhodococcus sp. 06-156-4C]OZD24367.1 PucR family transcriptional regulator [Rhodococcus sp. 06-156-3C]
MRLDTSFTHSPGTVVTEVPRGRSSALEGRSGAVVDRCLRAGRLPAPAELEPVRRAAEDLAREGVPLRDAQRFVHAAATAGLKGSVAEVDRSGVVDNAVFMMRVLESLGNAVSAAYMEFCRQDPGSNGERVAQLVDLLVADDPEARGIAERNGIEVATEYDVIFVRFVTAASDADRPGAARTDVRSVDNAALAAAESTMAAASGVRGPLLSLTTGGGVVLVPSSPASVVEDCLTRLAATLHVDTVAATARGTLGSLNGVLGHCRELVDLARSLRMEPRLYRTSDLALEYQLSRPGPGRSRLRSVIAPLDGFPELMHTLKTFVGSEANRRASAKLLYVHPNTVDYRLKRIEQLTGVDPLSSAGLMSLHAALVVDCLSRANEPGGAMSDMVAEAS